MFAAPRTAHRVIYLCDASGSMIVKGELLKQELQRAITSLKPVQSFCVIFFHDDSVASSSKDLTPAREMTKRAAAQFIQDTAFGGSTDPLPGLDMAFRLKPELIYFLTDGDFADNAAVLQRVRQLRQRCPAQVNTIAFVGAEDKDTAFVGLLKNIASETHGSFKMVRIEELSGQAGEKH